MLRTIPRTVVTGSITLVRIPVDLALRVLGRGGAGSAAARTVDRLDASARHVAGRVLGDERLQEDAHRRHRTADERGEAARLRAEADRAAGRAQERVQDADADGQRRREQADRAAKRRREQAEQQREAKRREAHKAAEQRLQASERAAARREDTVEDRTRKERLDQLDDEAEALQEQQDALTARDEARRLREAAGRAKAQRKG